MAQWLELDPDVDAYYRLHGVERSTLGEASPAGTP
jgi:hypothetical protein